MFSSKELSLIIILSSLGGITSILIGYAGDFISQIPLLSFVGGQFFSGAHVFWLILAPLIVKRRGSAFITGTIKGFIEMALFSHLSIFAFAVSFVEGLFVEVILGIPKESNDFWRYLAGGFSSASNIFVLFFFFFPPLPIEIYFLMFCSSFLSGLIFGGYLANRVSKILIV